MECIVVQPISRKLVNEFKKLKKYQQSFDKDSEYDCHLCFDMIIDRKYEFTCLQSKIYFDKEIQKYTVIFSNIPNEYPIVNIRFHIQNNLYTILYNPCVKINKKQCHFNIENGIRNNKIDIFYHTQPQYIIYGTYKHVNTVQLIIDDILFVEEDKLRYIPLINKLCNIQQGKQMNLISKTLNYYKRHGLKSTLYKIGSYLSKSNYIDTDECIVYDYDSSYQSNSSYHDKTTIKPICFYLPQFHRFKENDEWWGKGFTEWTNTRKAYPKYMGHYEPREPHKDIGYYKLDNKNIFKKQAMLAKEHGIYGFCFYYYWFSGKRLMEKALDIFLENKDIDINFCLCWANENWTRTWDGLENDILIKQEYTDSDNVNFIKDIAKYLVDERYIRIDNKPVILVYDAKSIPDCKTTFTAWRNTAKEIGIGEILIWVCQTNNSNSFSLGIIDYIDAEVEFPPHCANVNSIDTSFFNIPQENAPGGMYLYDEIVNSYINRNIGENIKPVYKTAMMSWDNSARKQTGWHGMYKYSLYSFYTWLNKIFEYTEKTFIENERFMFINAWNEWAEGTYLEPDKKTGYANINTFSNALFKKSFLKDIQKINSINVQTKIDSKNKIAIQAHIFYTDLAGNIIEELNKIPYKYDCYISTDTKEKAEELIRKFKEKSLSKNIFVDVFENRGRDMFPFISQISKVIDKYDYICHIHSKKTLTNTVGDDWRTYLFNNLFGSKENIQGIFEIFETTNTGIIFPETFISMLPAVDWGSNFENARNLLTRMHVPIMLPKTHLIFPVGNMFWAKTKAVKQIFKYCTDINDYAMEAGQVDGTFAHAIERLWAYLAEYNGYTYTQTLNYTK